MYLRFLAFEGRVPAALVGAVPEPPRIGHIISYPATISRFIRRSRPRLELSTLTRHPQDERAGAALAPGGKTGATAIAMITRALWLTEIDGTSALLTGRGKSRDTLLPLPRRAMRSMNLRPSSYRTSSRVCPGRGKAPFRNQAVRRRERDSTQSVRS